MSMVQQIIQAVTATQREISSQISMLQTYNNQINQVMQLAQTELSGSTQHYAQNILNQLQQTKSQIEDTITKLQAANNKLTQVRAI